MGVRKTNCVLEKRPTDEASHSRFFTYPPNQNDVLWIAPRARPIFFYWGDVTGSGDMCHQIKHVQFFEKMSFSQPWGARKSWGINFYVYSILFGHFTAKMMRGQKITVNGQNRKKWRKQTPIIFWFYMKICLPTFSGSPWSEKVTLSPN